MNRFCREFNDERPHEALGQRAPATVYKPSPRSWSGKIAEPVYPPFMQTRKVMSRGMIKWRGEIVYLSLALAGETVGLQEVEGGWLVYFTSMKLGRIDNEPKHTGRYKLLTIQTDQPETNPNPKIKASKLGQQDL